MSHLRFKRVYCTTYYTSNSRVRSPCYFLGYHFAGLLISHFSFLKVCMNLPFRPCEPCIPHRLLSSHNLAGHQNALLPFLHHLPMPFSFLFETDEIHNHVRESDLRCIEEAFRKFIDDATTLNDEGNKACERGDYQ